VARFDDGFAYCPDIALPERGLVSALYVTTGFLRGAPGRGRAHGVDDPMLAWSQLTRLRDQGVEIGAHSHTHPHRDKLYPAAVRDEIMR
jgi:peptidoglycan/xylan/chitin deacetylase (PgdA/CDA1 family)